MGWIKLDRDLANHELWLEEPFSRGQAWVDLILLASHKDTRFWKRGILVEQKRGQVGISIKGLAARWHWSRGKVKRFLNDLKVLHQIDHQNDNVTTLITLTNYEKYQGKRTPDETTDGHQTDTRRTQSRRYKKVEEKEDILSSKVARPPVPCSEIVSYLNEKIGTNYRPTTGSTKNAIKARVNEGFSLEDFRQVIDAKVAEWSTDAKMIQFLRPQTLFGTKFESYLQAAKSGNNGSGRAKSEWDI